LVEVIVRSLNQELPTNRSELLIGIGRSGHGRDAAKVWVGTRLILRRPISVDTNLGGAFRGWNGGGRQVQDVDVGVARQ
jgi:hypothetical protein